MVVAPPSRCDRRIINARTQEIAGRTDAVGRNLAMAKRDRLSLTSESRSLFLDSTATGDTRVTPTLTRDSIGSISFGVGLIGEGVTFGFGEAL